MIVRSVFPFLVCSSLHPFAQLLKGTDIHAFEKTQDTEPNGTGLIETDTLLSILLTHSFLQKFCFIRTVPARLQLSARHRLTAPHQHTARRRFTAPASRHSPGALSHKSAALRRISPATSAGT